MSINKELRLTERFRMNFRLVALSFLNHPFFEINTGNSSPTSTAFGQITAANGARTVQFRGSIEW